MGEELKIMEEEKTGTVFIRTKKERNYTVMDNTFLRDDKLSARAKGIFAYILYLPEDWCIYQNELVKHFKDGKDALRAAIKELEALGYITKEKIKNSKGQFSGWQYTVNEIPILPKSEIPMSETPKSVNPPLLNTNNKINTDNNNISTSLNSEPPKFNPTSTTKKTSSRTKKTETEKHEEYLSSLLQIERDEAAKCVDLFIDLHKQLDPYYNRDKSRLTWQVEFVKYHKDSTRSFEQIRTVLSYGMNNEFWKTRLSSPKILFNAFETILQQFLRVPSNYSKNRKADLERSNMNTGHREYEVF